MALEELNYDSSNDAIRAIDGKTMIIVGDADGVELEHAIELFKLRGGGDREAAARGFLTEAPRARLAILPATSHIGIMAEAERIAEFATPVPRRSRPAPAHGLLRRHGRAIRPGVRPRQPLTATKVEDGHAYARQSLRRRKEGAQGFNRLFPACAVRRLHRL